MAEEDKVLLVNSLKYQRLRTDVLARLYTEGLASLSLDILQRLNLADVKRCQRVSKLWHSMTEDMWNHKERKELGLAWFKGRPKRQWKVECKRERAGCTVSDLALDERGLAVALASSGRLEMWDKDPADPDSPYEKLWSVLAHEDGIYAVDLGEDILASGGDDAAVRLWSRSKGQLLHEMKDAHELIIWRVGLLANSLFACSYDCTISFWTLRGKVEPALERRVKGPLQWSDAMATDCRCSRMASFDESTYDVLVWNLKDAKTALVGNLTYEVGQQPEYVLAGHTDEVNCAHFAPGRDDLLVTGGADAQCRLWHLDISGGWQCLRTLQGMSSKIWSVNVDRRRVVAAGRRGEVGVWPLDSNERREFRHLPLPHGALTAVGQVRLDRGSVVTADGLAAVVVSHFWSSSDEGPKEEKCELCGGNLPDPTAALRNNEDWTDVY